jgi:iron complex outermembrane receptor protein
MLLLGASAIAQPQQMSPASAAAQSDTGTALEEVVVTARRREEKLQSVPIAISVVSGDALTEHSISNAVDLGKLVPALNTSETTRDLEGYEIRGMSNNNASAQGQSPVITPYFAEVPYPTGDGGGPGRFYDLENLQVLKGPQGTLFGRNSTGGALLFQPRKPTNDYHGYISAEFGNYTDIDLQGAVNLPIVDDKLLIRIAGDRAQRDGFTKDVISGKELDNRDYWAGRASAIFRPVDDFENYLVVDSLYSHTNGSSEINGGLNPGAVLATIPLGALGNVPLTLGTGPLYSGLLNPATKVSTAIAGYLAKSFAILPTSQVLAAQALAQSLGPREVAAGNNPLLKLDSLGITDIARWDVSDNLTIRNILGYREFKLLTRYDSDGTALPILGQVTPSGWANDLAQYTEELQFQGKSLNDSLVWVVGAFGLYAHTIGYSATVYDQLGALTTTAVDPDTRSEAVYAQATYDFGNASDALEGLKLTTGYRFTWDYRSLGLNQVNGSGACSAPGADKNCEVSVNSSGSQPSWNVSLDYQLTPDTLLYVTGRRGFRAGGLNSQSLIPSQISFKPETVKDVEIGVKSDWEFAGIKARTDVAAFHTDYANKQASEAYSASINGTVVTTNLIVNAGNATIEGLEADITLVPIKDLELTGNWAYTQAKYDQYLIVATGQTVPGATYPFVPQNKFSLGARYHLPLPDSIGDVSVSGTFSFNSHQYLGVFPSDPPETTIGGNYSTIDLAADWKNVMNYPVDVSLFANNVTNTIYRIGGIPVYGVVGFASFFYGEPTMYGARLRYHW